MICKLDRYWARQGCCLLPPGAAPAARASLAGASGRRGLPPDGLEGVYRYTVLLRPAPPDTRRLFLASLGEAGIDRAEHDLRWLPLDGGRPGWQVLLDGRPLATFAYLPPAEGGGAPAAGMELSLERLALASQRRRTAASLAWSGRVTYGDLHGVEAA